MNKTSSASEFGNFANLDEDEQEKETIKAIEIVRQLNVENSRYSAETFIDSVKDQLSRTCFEQYYLLSDPLKEKYWSWCYNGISVDIFFLIQEYMSDSEPVPFDLDRDNYFVKFDSLLTDSFEHFIPDLGSEHFRKRLFEYFAKYGSRQEWTVTNYHEDYHWDPGEYDQYMMQSALILKNAYSEEKVLKVLDKIINEVSISAIDFIRLVRSENDCSQYPLSWALNMV